MFGWNRKKVTLPNRDSIQMALGRLLDRKNEDAFLILEDRNTQKFVQFATHPGGLLLDLPTDMLSADEIERTETILGKPVSSTTREGAFESFMSDCGHDTASATTLVLRLFSEVFFLKESFDLRIEEN